MFYGPLADGVVVGHFAFVLFIIFGGLIVFRWRRWVWIHLPCVLWGALNEFFGWVCPLTPLENWLRETGGKAGYQTSFVEHYILPILYPATLTREVQIILGLMVLAVNVGIYGWIWRRRKR
jgi:hypothetical protein